MNVELYRRAREVFVRVIELEPCAREPFLDSECASDSLLRTEVTSLLTAHEQRNGFDSVPRAPEDAPRPLEAAQVPAHIGGYRILDVLGEGGMGIVYLAEQDSPRRPVALKLLPAGLAQPERLRRFQRESEILGRLQHPGIARIYQAGTAKCDTGSQPYFSMELVVGRPITVHARERELGVDERVRLLIQVAKAVHYAHEHGIVHRDLKPDNVFVEAAGTAKVLDFGIARAVDADLSATTEGHSPALLLGTLPYMSPEQLHAGQDIDARTDVYALGVIAYELLAGRLPQDVSGRPLGEAISVLISCDPPRLGALDRKLRGDLEAIVAAAMERDPARRYPSAEDFAADLDRFLHGEPVRARPLTTLYQLGKFTRRNRVLVAGILATFVALAAGLVGIYMQSVRARHQTELAEKRNTQLQSIYEFLDRMLYSSNPDELGREATIVDFLHGAASELDRETGVDPLVEASLRFTIGTTYERLGHIDDALRNLERSHELFQRLDPLETGDAPALTALALSDVYGQLGRLDLAEPLVRSASASLLRERGIEAFHLDEVSRHLPTVLVRLGRAEEAAQLLSAILATHRRVLGEAHSATVDCMVRLASALTEQRRSDEALDLLFHARELATSSQEIDPSVRGALLFQLALTLCDAGRSDEARGIFSETVAFYRARFGPDNPYTLNAVEQQAMHAQASGQEQEALALLEDILERRRVAQGESHPARLLTMSRMAAVMVSLELRDEARAVLDELTTVLPTFPFLDQVPGIELRLSVASTRRSLGQDELARSLAEEALESARRLSEDHPLRRRAEAVVASLAAVAR